MINIYKFHHCPSLLETPGFEPTTSRSQSGDANHSAIPANKNIITAIKKLARNRAFPYWTDKGTTFSKQRISGHENGPAKMEYANPVSPEITLRFAAFLLSVVTKYHVRVLHGTVVLTANVT